MFYTQSYTNKKTGNERLFANLTKELNPPYNEGASQ